MRPASHKMPHNAKYHNSMATEENKKKIVETALQMFNSRGVRGVTMDDIASAMHISKRTLYESFANKEELLFECMMLVRDEITNLHKRSYCTVDEPLLMAVYMVRVNAMSNFKYKHLREEIIRYYPEINEQFRELNTSSFRQTLNQALQYAQDNHYLRPNMNIDMIVDFITNYVQHNHNIDTMNSSEYGNHISEICFTFLRGMMSIETISRYEEREKEFKSIMESLMNQEKI